MRVFFIPKMRRVILPLQLRPSTEAFFYPSSEVNFIFTLQLRGIIFIPSKDLLFIVSLLAQFLIKKSEIVTTHKKKRRKKNNDGWKLKTPVPHVRSYEFAQYLWNLFEIIFESLFSKNSKARFFKWKSWIIQVFSLQIKQAFTSSTYLTSLVYVGITMYASH